MKPSFSISSLIAASVAMSVTATTGVAAGDGGAKYAGSDRPWIVTIGLWTIGQPKFAGSDELEASVKPILQLRRAGDREWLSLPTDNGGPALFQTDRLRIGPSFNFVSARKQGDDASLAGLGNVPWTLEAGVFVEYWLSPFLRTRAELRRGVNGHEGIVGNLAADVVLRPDARWTWSIGPRVGLADSDFMGTYFGVTAAQSTASGLRAFAAGGGVYSAGVAASVKYKWSENWSTMAFAQYDRLVGDAADSPITAAGSADQVTVGIGAAYSFHWR